MALAGALGGCASTFPALVAPQPHREAVPLTAVAVASPSSMDGLISKYSVMYDVPEALIRRVIVRESGYNPRARNGPYYGLMQIRYDTAQSMGYQGPASGLLDADTNLRYAVKYLSGAYVVGDSNANQAVRNYASGYYYDAKAKGLLEEVGLR
jgi:soluble lytic murein transglycosylase-like protein